MNCLLISVLGPSLLLAGANCILRIIRRHVSLKERKKKSSDRSHERDIHFSLKKCFSRVRTSYRWLRLGWGRRWRGTLWSRSPRRKPATQQVVVKVPMRRSFEGVWRSESAEGVPCRRRLALAVRTLSTAGLLASEAQRESQPHLIRQQVGTARENKSEVGVAVAPGRRRLVPALRLSSWGSPPSLTWGVRRLGGTPGRAGSRCLSWRTGPWRPSHRFRSGRHRRGRRTLPR